MISIALTTFNGERFLREQLVRCPDIVLVAKPNPLAVAAAGGLDEILAKA